MNLEQEFEENAGGNSRLGGRNLLIILVAVVAVALAGVAYFYVNGPREEVAEDLSGPVAIVNGEEITREDFNIGLEQTRAMQGPLVVGDINDAELERQVLDGLISETVLFQEAEREGYSANESQVQEHWDMLREQFESEEEFREEMAKAGVSENDLRDSLRRNVTIQNYLDVKVPEDSVDVTEDEIQEQITLFEMQFGDQEDLDREELRSMVESEIRQQKRQELIITLLADLERRADIQRLL